MADSSYCLVLPHYNHLPQFTAFLPQLLTTNLPMIVVDDGSDAQTRESLRALLKGVDQCTLVEHQVNQGKGGALKSGLLTAKKLGFSHALQIDSDGQHDTYDIAKFIAYSREHPNHIVSGAPIFAADAPKARVHGRKITNFWVALETWSIGFRDSLCGFRIYPISELVGVMNRYQVGSRMDFDTEILVKSVWHGMQVHFIETKVIYHANPVSHFRYLQDNVGLIGLHIRLMLGMLVRAPLLAWRRMRGQTASV